MSEIPFRIGCTPNLGETFTGNENNYYHYSETHKIKIVKYRQYLMHEMIKWN